MHLTWGHRSYAGKSNFRHRGPFDFAAIYRCSHSQHPRGFPGDACMKSLPNQSPTDWHLHPDFGTLAGPSRVQA